MPPKFKVGDIVTLKPSVNRNVPGGIYEVIKVLPDHNGEREYRIKNAACRPRLRAMLWLSCDRRTVVFVRDPVGFDPQL